MRNFTFSSLPVRPCRSGWVGCVCVFFGTVKRYYGYALAVVVVFFTAAIAVAAVCVAEWSRLKKQTNEQENHKHGQIFPFFLPPSLPSFSILISIGV